MVFIFRIFVEVRDVYAGVVVYRFGGDVFFDFFRVRVYAFSVFIFILELGDVVRVDFRKYKGVVVG